MSLNNVYKRIQLHYQANRWYHITSGKKCFYIEPYPIAAYSKCLKLLKSSKITTFPKFTEKCVDKAVMNAFVRHDIDTEKCIRNMDLLVNVDKKNGIKSGLYFRSDDASGYDLNNYRSQICKYHNEGFEIGLHTVCYQKDNFILELKKEREQFEKALGFPPLTLTIHGMGRFRFEIRTKLLEYIAINLENQGFYFTDCMEKYRKYDYVIHDSHLNPNNKRYILSDFVSPPLMKNKSIIILTHPCYWIPDANEKDNTWST